MHLLLAELQFWKVLMSSVHSHLGDPRCPELCAWPGPAPGGVLTCSRRGCGGWSWGHACGSKGRPLMGADPEVELYHSPAVSPCACGSLSQSPCFLVLKIWRTTCHMQGSWEDAIKNGWNKLVRAWLPSRSGNGSSYGDNCSSFVSFLRSHY